MYSKLTIKIGSNVLANNTGGLNHDRVSHLVDQIAALHHSGKKIVLVSSGAVASARGLIQMDKKLDRVSQRQVLSSVGQVKLTNIYSDLFARHGIQVGQVLVTKQDFRTRDHYLNMKNCVSALWQNNILPIVNENDAVSVTALMFTDNDELSGMMASMMGCKGLIILSNINGIYNGHPEDPESKVIRLISKKDEDLGKYISTTKSDFGRGGMLTKCNIAKKTATSGIGVHIANGTRDNVLIDLLKGDDSLEHTHFEASEPKPAIKQWMAYSDGFAKAEVKINEGACNALYAPKANSLLLAGVVSFNGSFKKGDLLRIKNEQNETIGIGKAAYDIKKAEEHLNDKKYKPLVHYDYLYLYPELINETQKS
ncbi:glutamate 5-kinase [Carboxylicivirga linearis]|uniref:Glutamate 5-kinase n=1 Tax=Carboxylicivirga linearis TaxID=1628157 RepID=A0ABS5JPZ6_9BACT|nr:glutamate 5-kinase [Carboxylicivirga linearis]MBS2096958.1 glutamate 5-kinase [Carboxylicivirga linearis]